jgi:hypothetical protein
MRYKPLLVGAALVAALVPRVSATVLLPGDLGDIARSATAIVRATVVGVRSEWADGRRRIETIVTLQVSETFKGDMRGLLSVKVPGGMMGRYRSVTVGAPSFRQGEEVVLFLGASPPALPYVIGLGQGVFRVQRDVRTGSASVTPPALLADAARTVTVSRGDPARRPQTLQQFAESIRSALAARSRDPRDLDRPADRGAGRTPERHIKKISQAGAPCDRRPS